jgi:hypothetical protein
MLEWLRKPGSGALEGTPATPRLKTYTAESGYVYHYFYQGHRAVRSPKPATEHVFQVSTDRRAYAPVSVLLGAAAVAAFEEAHARPLNPTERYAVVKLALFQAFDGHPGPAALRGPVSIGAADVERIAETLGFL